jgi:hypothetical protein
MGAVTWSETLEGFVSKDKRDFNQALRDGKRNDRKISAHLRLEVQDVDRFVEGAPMSAKVTRKSIVKCAELNGDLEVLWGVFELFVPGTAPADHLHLRMRYRLNLRDQLGEKLALRGFKVVENDPGYDSWCDTSTLFVRIYRGEWNGSDRAGDREQPDPRYLDPTQLEDEESLAAQDDSLVATAVMQISVAAFLRELLTFSGSGESRSARRRDILRYGRAFGEGLVKAYWGAPVSDGCASFPIDHERSQWRPRPREGEPEPVIGRDRAMEMKDKDGADRVRYALQRSVFEFRVPDLAFPLNLQHVEVKKGGKGPSPDEPGEKGPVLLVHGAGVRAEMFYGQPEGETVVDYLLREGYDVWCENWRGSIDVPNNSYTLDRVAAFDHPAAVEKLLDQLEKEGRRKPLRALVHCQGSVSFVAAAVAGYLQGLGLTRVVSTAISLFFDVPYGTFVKQRSMMPIVSVFGTGADPQWGIRAPTPSGAALARVARASQQTLPGWQSRAPSLLGGALKRVGRMMQTTIPGERPCRNPACQIANYIYGEGPDVLLRHANISEGVHEWCSRELGYSPFSLIGQVAESCRYGRLWSAERVRDDAPVNYVAQPPKCDEMRFTFLGAGEDRMFLPSGQKRTAAFFQECGFAEEDARYRSVGDYGHMDVYWGVNAPRDVFPKIGAALQ